MKLMLVPTASAMNSVHRDLFVLASNALWPEMQSLCLEVEYFPVKSHYTTIICYNDGNTIIIIIKQNLIQ